MSQRRSAAVLASTWRREGMSLAQSLNSVLPTSTAQRYHGFEEGPGGGGRHLENRIFSVLWVFNRSVHVVKDLSTVVTS